MPSALATAIQTILPTDKYLTPATIARRLKNAGVAFVGTSETIPAIGEIATVRLGNAWQRVP